MTTVYVVVGTMQHHTDIAGVFSTLEKAGTYCESVTRSPGWSREDEFNWHRNSDSGERQSYFVHEAVIDET